MTETMSMLVELCTPSFEPIKYGVRSTEIKLDILPSSLWDSIIRPIWTIYPANIEVIYPFKDSERLLQNILFEHMHELCFRNRALFCACWQCCEFSKWTFDGMWYYQTWSKKSEEALYEAFLPLCISHCFCHPILVKLNVE